MDRERAIQFCHKYAQKQFYQPIVFVPGVVEIRGKWHKSTQDLADIVLSDCFGKSVLDLGCMHGYFLHEAKKRGATKAVGVDHDAVEMSIAEEVNEIFNDGVELIFEDLTKYTSNDPFDIVLMMNVTHVLDDPTATIVRFLNLSKEQLIVEYRKDHDGHFPRQPDRVFDSPRSAGYRKLALFEVPQG